MTERAEVEKKPPAYVKITKVPKHGNLVVKQRGQQVVLTEGDLVQTSIFKNFVYDQGRDVCSTKNEAKCQDSFSYVTYSEWVGKGPQQTSDIEINPISREMAIAAGMDVAPLKSAAGQPVQLTKSAAPEVKSSKCDGEYPIGMVAGLGFAIVCLMVPLAIVATQIKQLNSEGKQSKVTELDSSPKERG